MKIGIIGTRGIPNQHGGFEQFTEFVAPLMVQKGYHVTVYNSSLHPYKSNTWNDVNIVIKSDLENKLGTFAQFLYDLNCIIDCRKQKFDIILQLGYTSSSIWSFLFPAASKVITNMDGLEWKRSKYSVIVKKFLKYAEKKAVNNSDVLIADSVGIQQHIRNQFNKPSVYIPYGAICFEATETKVLQSFKVLPFEYDLLIARMEPENNIETVIRGHLISASAKPLLIIGSTANKYGTELKLKYRSEKIVFCEAVYDLQILNHLRYYSHLYFHGHSVGGTNPSLLEAMASQALIVAHDNIFNRSVTGGEAFYFNTAEDISTLLSRCIEKMEYREYLEKNSAKIISEYSWQKIANSLETCFVNALKHS